MFVPRLVRPVLTGEGVHLVRGFYRRPSNSATPSTPTAATVTELVARPLLAALRPELGAVLQPLGGEYAGTRETAHLGAVRAGLRRGDRDPDRHLRQVRP